MNVCICVHVFVHQGKLGPISTRVHKAEQYFNQAGTDCSVNSCPELLRRGKGGYLALIHLRKIILKSCIIC